MYVRYHRGSRTIEEVVTSSVCGAHQLNSRLVPTPELRWYYFGLEFFLAHRDHPDCVSKVEETTKFLHYSFSVS